MSTKEHELANMSKVSYKEGWSIGPLTLLRWRGWLFGLLSTLCVLSCSGEKTLDLHSACFRIEAYVKNPGALGLASITFHVQQAPGQKSVHTRPLVVEGSGLVAARFLADSLLLIKPDTRSIEEPAGQHAILRLPMLHVQSIFLGKPPDNPFSIDSICEESADTLASTRVSFSRDPGRPDIRMVWYDNPAKNQYRYAILLAPVDSLSEELLDEETLRLDVRWQDVNNPETIMVKLPIGNRNEFEYSIAEPKSQ